MLLAALTARGVQGLLRARGRDGQPGSETGLLVAASPRPTPAAFGSSSQPRILLILPAQEYWHPDYAGVRQVLDREGAHVVVAATTREPIQPSRWGGGESVTPDRTLAEARASDFDAVIFSGGANPRFLGEASEAARSLVREMEREGKVIAGVCRGVGSLAKIDVLQGKKATGTRELAAFFDFKNIVFVNEPVVVDGNIITGRDDKAAPQLAETVLAELRKRR